MIMDRDAARELTQNIVDFLAVGEWATPRYTDHIAEIIRSAISQETRELREALEEISKADPQQSKICGDNAPTTCDVGCIGCIARAALAKHRTA